MVCSSSYSSIAGQVAALSMEVMLDVPGKAYPYWQGICGKQRYIIESRGAKEFLESSF